MKDRCVHCRVRVGKLHGHGCLFGGPPRKADRIRTGVDGLVTQDNCEGRGTVHTNESLGLLDEIEQTVPAREHQCLGGVWSTEPTWWAKDAQGIELCRVCSRCWTEKLSRYRPEILSGYDQQDVDEPIEEDS